MKGVVFRMQGIREREMRIDESSDAERSMVTMTLMTPQRARTIQLMGIRDDRTLAEISGDEVRIVDLNQLEGNQLEFGRYRLEWWSAGTLGFCFGIDGFKVLG